MAGLEKDSVRSEVGGVKWGLVRVLGAMVGGTGRVSGGAMVGEDKPWREVEGLRKDLWCWF